MPQRKRIVAGKYVLAIRYVFPIVLCHAKISRGCVRRGAKKSVRPDVDHSRK